MQFIKYILCLFQAASGRRLRPPAWSSGFGVACFAAAFFAASLPAASAAALGHGSSSTVLDWSVVAGVVAAVAVISAALFGCLSGGATKEAKIQELEATIKSLERDNGTLRAALAAKSQGDVVLQLLEEVAAYRVPAHSPVFRDQQYARGWAVINIFFQGHGNELIQAAVAFRDDIVTYQALVRTWLGDPRVHTDTEVKANNPKGFALLPTDVFFTQAEPCRSLRREALSFLKTAIQEGSAKAFCAQVEKLAELSFGVLAGAPFSPGSSSSGGGKGGEVVQHVPPCFDGKGSDDRVPKAAWSPAVERVLKQAYALYEEADKPGGKQIACVPTKDLNGNACVMSAGIMYAYDEACYQDYLYAACIVQAAPFAARIEAAFATAAATVHMGTLKSTGRFNAKANEYIAEGKPDNPVIKHAKDVLRCLVTTAGHDEMKQSVATLHAHFTVRSTKDRVAQPTHDVVCVVELEDGLLAEVQFGFIAVVGLKALGHEGYKYARVDTRDLDSGAGMDALFLEDVCNPPSIKDARGAFTAGFADVSKEDTAVVQLV